MRDIFADIKRVNAPAILESGALLLGVKRNLCLAFVCGIRHGIVIEQAFHELIAEYGFLNDFGGIFGLHVPIKYAGRLDRHERSHLTKALTAASNHIDIIAFVIFRTVGFERNRHFEIALKYLAL